MFLLGGGEVVGERDGVVLVDLGRDLVEARDERVLQPVHEELRPEHQQAVRRQRPEALCIDKRENIKWTCGGRKWSLLENGYG